MAGPYFEFSVPEPTGVVAVLAPQRSRLLGLVSVLAPVLAGGNTAVVVTLQGPPAAGDHPGRGAGHLRRPGRRGQRADRRPGGDRRRGWPRTPTSTRIDLAGAPAPAGDGAGARGGRHLKRVLRAAADEDWTADPGLSRLRAFLETKTVWHPIGV